MTPLALLLLGAAVLVAVVPAVVWLRSEERGLLFVSSVGLFGIAVVGVVQQWPGWVSGVPALAALVIGLVGYDEVRNARDEP